ncbi:MAG: hypothetical protein RBU37_24180, partial [Myxococcota bacterium]|nr:hypothetical protein [Myxococcota bacterium]
MSSSSKKPGAKDISDLKARLGLAKSKDDAPKDGGAAPDPSAAPAAPASPMAPPMAAAPVAPAMGMAPSPMPTAASPLAPAGFAPAPNPLAAPAYVAPAPAPVEEDRYDYEPPPVPEKPDFDPNQYDPSIKQPRSMGKMITSLVVMLLRVSAAFAVGMVFQNILDDRSSVNR